MATYTAASLTSEGDIVGSGGAVVVSPQAWVGRPFPLLKHLDIDEDLSHGEWIVVLHRPKCSKCADAVANVTDLAREMFARGRPLQIALIDVAAKADTDIAHLDRAFGIRLGSLDTRTEWVIQTPFIIKLHSGQVVELDLQVKESMHAT